MAAVSSSFLDDVVGPVVDLHLDGVAAVVDEEDDAPLVAPEHRGHVLRRHLEAAVADAGDDALVRGALGVAEQRAHGPADGTVLHLELVPASLWQPELLAVEPRVSRLGDDGAVAGEHPLDVLEEDVDVEGLAGLALGRLPVGDEDPPVVVVGGGVGAHALGQRRQEVLHHDAAEGGAAADGDAVRLHHHRLVLVEQERVAHGAVVVEDGAREEVGVGGLDDLGAEGRAHGAPVGAQEPRQRLWHQALGRRRRRRPWPRAAWGRPP